MSAIRLPACIAALLLPFASFAQIPSASAPPAPQAQPAPTPFQGMGTLAATPAPAPAPVKAAPASAPAVVYEKPDVQLTTRKDAKNAGIRLGGVTNAVPPAFFLEGTIHAFHTPPGNYYRVQCFFMLKAPDGKPLIYAAKSFGARGDFNKVSYPVPGAGSASGLYALPDLHYKFAGNKTGGSAPVTDVTQVQITGNTPFATATMQPPMFDGWIMRIYAADQLVYLGASQGDYIPLAQDNPGYFDKIFSIYNNEAGAPRNMQPRPFNRLPNPPPGAPQSQPFASPPAPVPPQQ